MTELAVLRLVDILFTLYSFAIILRALLTWIRVDYYHPVVRFLIQITEPVLAPLRRNVPPVGSIDISPMLALILLYLLEMVVQALVTIIF